MNELFNFIHGSFSDFMSLNGRAISEKGTGKNWEEAACLVRSMEISEKPKDIRYADGHSNEFNYKRISLRQMV